MSSESRSSLKMSSAEKTDSFIKDDQFVPVRRLTFEYSVNLQWLLVATARLQDYVEKVSQIPLDNTFDEETALQLLKLMQLHRRSYARWHKGISNVISELNSAESQLIDRCVLATMYMQHVPDQPAQP